MLLRDMNRVHLSTNKVAQHLWDANVRLMIKIKVFT